MCQFTTGTVVYCNNPNNLAYYVIVDTLALPYTPLAWNMAGSHSPVWNTTLCCASVVAGCTVAPQQTIQGECGGLLRVSVGAFPG